jgi:hypothetical protein
VEIDKIPGYQRAKERGGAIEESIRGNAFLSIPEKICGIEVRPLTLRIVRRLKVSRSPFICGGPTGAGDCLVFLWAVSPGYLLRTKKAREKAKTALIEKARGIPYRRAVRGIRRYLFYTSIDRPPTPRGKKNEGSFISLEAAIVHQIASAYSWDDEAILDKPLRRLYQYLTMIRLCTDPKAKTFNPIIARLTRPLKRKYLNS